MTFNMAYQNLLTNYSTSRQGATQFMFLSRQGYLR